MQERADEHELLTHAVRIASHRIAKGTHELKALGKLGDALGAYIGRHLEDVGKVGEVLDSRHELVDVGVVGDIGDEALCCHGVARNVDAAHADAAPVDALHAHDRADEGGLASAVMADETIDIAGLNRERDVAHRYGFPVTLLVMIDSENGRLGGVLDGHGISLLWW